MNKNDGNTAIFLGISVVLFLGTVGIVSYYFSQFQKSFKSQTPEILNLLKPKPKEIVQNNAPFDPSMYVEETSPRPFAKLTQMDTTTTLAAISPLTKDKITQEVLLNSIEELKNLKKLAYLNREKDGYGLCTINVTMDANYDNNTKYLKGQTDYTNIQSKSACQFNDIQIGYSEKFWIDKGTLHRSDPKYMYKLTKEPFQTPDIWLGNLLDKVKLATLTTTEETVESLILSTTLVEEKVITTSATYYINKETGKISQITYYVLLDLVK